MERYGLTCLYKTPPWLLCENALEGHWEWALAVASVMAAVVSERDEGDGEPGMTVVPWEKGGQILSPVLHLSFPSHRSPLPAPLLPVLHTPSAHGH